MCAAIPVKSFSIDSSLGLPADSYTAETADASVFLNASPADTVTLTAGFVDPATGTPYTVGHLVGGIDEYELVFTPTAVVARIRGMDRVFDLLRRRMKRTYFPTAPEDTTLAKLDEEGQEWRVGSFRASQIASDVCAVAGLALSWGVRDYTMAETFDAVGTCMDILRKLIDPWEKVPVQRVMLYVQGNTLFIRQRLIPFTADYTFTAKDARIKNLSFRKRRAPFYGKVTLEGRLVPKGLTEEPGGGGGAVLLGGSEIEETKESKGFDAAGNLISKTVTTLRYRMPGKILLSAREILYGKPPEGGGVILLEAFGVLKDELKTNTWEESSYNQSGPTNQPRQLAQHSLVKGYHKDDKTKIFRELSKEYISFSYDNDAYLSMTTTERSELNLDTQKLEPTKKIIKTLKEVEFLKQEETTSTYEVVKPTAAGQGGALGSTGPALINLGGGSASSRLVLRSVETQISAGLPPGGKRPPRTIVSGKVGAQGTSADKETLVLEETLSIDATAEDVRYSNRNLTMEDLEYLMGLFRSASGKWEYELSMVLVAMPWVRKGMALAITNLALADGTPVPAEPGIVAAQTLTFDESGANPEMTARVKTMFWRDT